jgi:hypothetical protein
MLIKSFKIYHGESLSVVKTQTDLEKYKYHNQMCTIYISLLKKSSDQSVCVSYTKNKLGLNVCE